VTVYGHFLDELEKIAASRVSPKQMMQVVRRVAPEQGRHLRMAAPGDDLVRAYRKALRYDRSYEVPLTQRARNYKEWKRTGKLLGGKHMRGGLRFFGDPFLNWSPSKELVQVYSGGGYDGIRQAMKNPSSRLDWQFLLPGQTRSQSVGLYASPSRGVAQRFADDPSKSLSGTRGQGDVQSLMIPRRRMVSDVNPQTPGNQKEYVIPGGRSLARWTR
jgi:hypothetical protein